MKLGSETSTSSQRGAERLGGRLHQRASGTRRRRRGGSRACRARRRSPRSCRARRRSPDRTTWPGALSLATVTPPASAISRASSRLAPTSASIEPLRASPIRRPRRTTSSSASSRLSTPAATSAASSPSEWPAPALGCRSERVPADDGRAEDGGLCEAGVLLHAGEGILADELSDLLEQLGRALGDQIAHLGGMAPLAREERRGLCCVAHTCTITHGRSTVTPSFPRYPLDGGWGTPRLGNEARDAGPSGPLRRGCARRACGTARTCAP